MGSSFLVLSFLFGDAGGRSREAPAVDLADLVSQAAGDLLNVLAGGDASLDFQLQAFDALLGNVRTAGPV